MAGAEAWASRELPPRGASVGDARALVRAALDEADARQWLDEAELAVSELVTNALVHAGTTIRVQVRVDGAGLRVEVADSSPHLPVHRDYAPTSGTGRGLHLVDDVVDEWGVVLHNEGKVVWFEIRSPTAPSDRETAGSARESPFGPAFPAHDPGRSADDTVAVELLNFPLLLHAAWQEHAATLLREFLLVTLDDELASFARHAQASDAMNLLHEQAPAPELRDDPDAIMATAIEPQVSVQRLVLTVPRTSLPHFETLDRMLGEATALARTGTLLAPPTQPEISDMRTWMCQQILAQAAGEEVRRPWTSSDHDLDHAQPGRSTEWDTTEVSGSDRSLLAADDAGLIVAASRSVLELLGYRHEDELLGGRLIRIVPARYHQAHIAGLTFHMTNGRSPLLGVPVVVPVVRADGTETRVSLTVEPRTLPRGQRIFTAELSAV